MFRSIERDKQAPLRGRGATNNPTGRFEAERVLPFDDSWADLDAEDDLEPFPTVVQPEVTRRILSSNRSPDVPFERSINPYKGCEHGCIYCFARPTHAYLGLSPGLDFETRIVSKPEAPALLRRELSRRGYQPEQIALGANTDPYQPAERALRISRGVLEVLLDFRHPVGIITKSAGILRDLDLLQELAAHNLVRVMVSVTTLDPTLARRMEPRAAAPRRRIATIERLTARGVPVGVLASPMIPGLNDAELEAILEACAAAGATAAGTILVRLPLEVAELFENWLRQHYPDRAERVLDLIRQTRGGALYRSDFQTRMKGTGPYADLLARRFRVAVRRLGLGGRLDALSTEHFRVPGRDRRQLPLF